MWQQKYELQNWNNVCGASGLWKRDVHKKIYQRDTFVSYDLKEIQMVRYLKFFVNNIIPTSITHLFYLEQYNTSTWKFITYHTVLCCEHERVLVVRDILCELKWWDRCIYFHQHECLNDLLTSFMFTDTERQLSELSDTWTVGQSYHAWFLNEW